MVGIHHRLLAVLLGELVALSRAVLLRGAAHNQTSLLPNASSKPASIVAKHALLQMASRKTNSGDPLPANALAEAELEKIHIEDALGVSLDDDKWAVDSVKDAEGIPDDTEAEMAELESHDTEEEMADQESQGIPSNDEEHGSGTHSDQDELDKFLSQDGGEDALAELSDAEKLGLAQDFAPSFIQEEAHDEDSDPEELAEAEVQNIELAEDLGIDSDESTRTTIAESGSDSSDDDEPDTEADIENDETTKTTIADSDNELSDDSIDDSAQDDDSFLEAAD